MYSTYKHTTRHGFTLVEMLVSVALLSIVMMIAIGTLLTIVDANRQAQSLASITSNLNFSLDTMSRTIRTGDSYTCTSPPGGNCTEISLTDHAGVPVKYTYNATDQSIERTVDTGGAERLTAPEVRVTDMAFIITGELTTDAIQPTVTLLLQAEAGTDPGTDTSLNIQMTLAQRLLDGAPSTP